LAKQVPGLGKFGVSGFAEELHCAGAEAPQGFKGYCAEHIPGACVLRVAVPALVSVPKSCSVARGASCGTKVRSSERMDERYVSKHMAGASAQVAMEVPGCLGMVRGAGSEPRIPALAAGGEAQAADKFMQHFGGVIVAALHKFTEPVAAEGVRDVVVFNCMAARARPGVAEGGERADSHANAGSVLEGLSAQAETGGVGDGVEPHAAGIDEMLWRRARALSAGHRRSRSASRARRTSMGNRASWAAAGAEKWAETWESVKYL
jgi:hypothetical protein